MPKDALLEERSAAEESCDGATSGCNERWLRVASVLVSYGLRAEVTMRAEPRPVYRVSSLHLGHGWACPLLFR